MDTTCQTLKTSRQQAAGLLAARIESGSQLAGQAELAERTGGYRDWLSLFATWRDKTIADEGLYVEREVSRQFGWTTEASERSSPSYTFPYKKQRSTPASTT